MEQEKIYVYLNPEGSISDKQMLDYTYEIDQDILEQFYEEERSHPQLETIKTLKYKSTGEPYIEEKPNPEYDNIVLNDLRRRRNIICFPVINRGKLWYDSLNPEQLVELNDWYNQWLDVTETKVVPNKPPWLI